MSLFVWFGKFLLACWFVVGLIAWWVGVLLRLDLIVCFGLLDCLDCGFVDLLFWVGVVGLDELLILVDWIEFCWVV